MSRSFDIKFDKIRETTRQVAGDLVLFTLLPCKRSCQNQTS